MHDLKKIFVGLCVLLFLFLLNLVYSMSTIGESVSQVTGIYFCRY